MKASLLALALSLITFCGQLAAPAATRLRGVMIYPPTLDTSAAQTLGNEWKANLVRWQLVTDIRWASAASEADYDSWLKSELQRLDAMLPTCQAYGLRVVIDLHTPPGGRGPTGQARVFTDEWARNYFLRFWRETAQKYANSDTVWAYDLLNEPLTGRSEAGQVFSAGRRLWDKLARKAALEIRGVDTRHAIVVEPAYGLPKQIRFLKPLDIPKVVYSVHMYHPGTFTHQGIDDRRTGVRYRSATGKAGLRRYLQPVIDFQEKHQAPIYIGEFSAVRWAPRNDARDYLRDCIDLFEEFGWNWTYHAFRECDCWSVEHGSDANNHNPSPTPTSRENLLRFWFGKNR